MKSFEKITRKTYDPLWIKQEFMSYDQQFVDIRSKYKYKCAECFKCSKRFAIGDMLALVCFKNVGNKVLCQSCAKDLNVE